MILKRTMIAASLMVAFHAVAGPDEIRSTLHDQQSIAVTIYNGDLALVKDQRKVNLQSGLNALALRDVSAQIRPETALLRSLSGQLQTLEQNFDYDLLSPEKLLEKYIGQMVQVIRTNPATGAETVEQAYVLAVNNGTVLKMGNRIETGVPGRIVYPDVPENLRDRPTLVTQVTTRQSGPQNIELSYLTHGLSWQADYVAELNAAEDRLDLSGWVTLSNTSGTTYRDAKLQLVAGNINRVAPPPPPMALMHKSEMMVADAAPAMAQEALLEYHLYTLERPTTLAENQTKQVALLSAQSVPVRKELVLRGSPYYYQSSQGDLGQKLKVGVFVEFDNKESAKLGKPIPKGIMRVYKKDSQGNAQFVGEDSIDHTAKNETVRLKLGEAFDVTANKKQTDFKKLPSPAKGSSQFESAYEIVIKNAKDQAVTVKVVEPIPGDWSLLAQSHPSTKTSSNTATWNINVPAEGSATLTYRVQVKH
ncbi:conserved hypothetical protein [Methylobacillus flagellatus KT]|uniref:DUF4139 domain-containing protein n=2 Tax=Methylobacillus flagellatus TaxID=405 RepID=Q1H155_METFK|nr:conserved hypothetical protein [Methylobacillus flagellatus KT]